MLLGFGSPICIAGGFIFGKWIGTILVVISLTCGATLLYILGNLFFKELFSSYKIIFNHFVTTFTEVIFGLSLSALLAVNIAIIIFFFKNLERSIYPLLIASQTIPVITLSPLLLVWFGPNILSKIIIVVIISFFPIIVNFLDGLKSVDTEMIKMSQQFGASKFQIFYKIYLPS